MDLPSQIGRYRVLEPLGRGSMAQVYLALDPHTDRKIALKLVAPSMGEEAQLAQDEMRRRFLLEARAAGRLNHPGIVTIYDADTEAATGLAYIAMEWVEGSTLAALLARESPLPIPCAVEIVFQVALALDHAHRQGIVHRDIKPANILVAADGRAKISDFGIARLTAESHTLAGQILGTPNYMAPEQIRNEPLDGRTDLYALGVVLYEALTGALPSRGDSLASIAYRIAHVDARPPAFLNADIPDALSAVIERSLAKDPAQRFHSGAELAEALAPFRGEPAAPRTVTAPAVTQPMDPAATALAPTVALGAGRRGAARRRAWLVTAAAAVLLASAALVVGFLRLSPAPERTTEPPPSSTVAPAPAPTPVAAEVSTPSPPLSARLRLVHKNRLRNAALTVWVDGERVHSVRLAAQKNALRRVGGDALEWTLDVPAGDRLIEVRITSAQGQVNAVGTVRGRFTAGGRRVLRVLLIPFNERLRLSWEE